MQKYHIQLSKLERKRIQNHLYNKKATMQSKKRGKVLLDLDEYDGKRRYTTKEISNRQGVSEVTIIKICRRYEAGGVDAVLERKKRKTPPVPAKVTGEVEAHIIATSCSVPPEGKAHWSMKMIADKLILDGVIESISDETVRLILKKLNSNHI